jgi:hypothetical protein
MKNGRTLQLIISLILMQFVDFALAASPSVTAIPLPGGLVLPNRTFTIRLDMHLQRDRYYRVSCDIGMYPYDPVPMKLSWNTIASEPYYHSVGEILLNGRPANHTVYIYELEKYEATDAWLDGANGGQLSLTFQNLDRDNSVEVKNCFAI